MDINEIVTQAIKRDIAIEGPVPVTQNSYPFCSMKHCRKPYDLADLGYCEEEYFISGFSNVYDQDDHNKMLVKQPKMPYKTRVLVRKPMDKRKFSGRVYLDILNATNNYDYEDLWSRIYDWCVLNGHGYIGITSKPNNVLALKYFNYERYKSLDWSNDKDVQQPAPLVYGSVPGTEEGLFWDMLSQTAYQIKNSKDNNFFNGWPVDYLYLTGQSQSGAYLNTYVHYFNKYTSLLKIYSGYMNIVGVQLERRLCQESEPQPLTFKYRADFETDIPMINITSEGDIDLFKCFGCDELLAHCPVNSDTANNKCRYYEVAGTPHFDIKCPVIVCDQDIIASKGTPHYLSPDKEPVLNDVPLACYVSALLEKLHVWVTTGKAPEIKGGFGREDGGNKIKRDQNGNVTGGLCPPMLDVPLATHYGFDESMPKIGSTHLFPVKKFLSLYSSKEDYLARFDKVTEAQVSEGWLFERDAEEIKKWARIMVEKISGKQMH